MAGNDRRIQFVLSGKDELSPAADSASEAMQTLANETQELNRALDDAKAAQGLVRELSAAEKELVLAEKAAARAASSIDKLQQDLEKAPKSASLSKSLREAERSLEAANQRIDAITPDIADLRTALSLAGVDTGNLAEEQKRLADEIEQSGLRVKAHSEKIAQQKSVEARAAREAAEAAAQAAKGAADAAEHQQAEERAAAEAREELTRKTQQAAAQARELLQSQREGAQATAEHTSQIGISVKRLAAYAAGLLGVGQVLGRIRDGITAVFRGGNDSEQALAQLNAALASTGNVAGMTAEQLQALASQLRSNSLFNTEQIVAAQTRLLSYTDVAAEQFPRAMQIVIDQAQRLGMSVEQSAETVGKALQSPAEAMAALSRQGFKLAAGQKELLQHLVATGRTAEAQAVIMDMLSEAYGGAAAAARLDAAAARLDTATGLWKRLTDQMGDFATRVADAGAFEYLKQKLREVGDRLQALADDGTLERWAKQASDAIVGVARSLESAGRWVSNHATAIKALAAAYAAFKLASMVAAMARWSVTVKAAAVQTALLTAETNALAAAQSRLSVAQVLSGGLGKLGGVVQIAARAFQFLAVRLAGWAGLAVLAADAGKPLGEMFAKMSPAVREAEASIARMNEQMREQHRAALLAADGLKSAADIQLKTTAQLRHSSEQERSAYLQRLQALEEYRKAQMRVAIYGREVGAITEKEFQSARNELAAVRKAMEDVATAADFTASAFKGRLTTGALELVEHFNAIRRSGKDAEEALTELGKGFDPSNADQLRDMGVLLQYLGQYGVLSGEQIQQFLINKLEKLSGKDLLRVQQVAKDVFEGIGRGAEALGMVVDASLGQALRKLGIDLEQVQTGFDKGTREALDAFSEVIRIQQESGRSAQDSAKLIEAAYVAARQKINDPAALDKLDAAFKSAAKSAGSTSAEISSGMARARGDIDNATGAIRDMGDALSRIGSASNSMELANIGVAASKAFHDGRMSAEQYSKVQDALRDKTRELKTGLEQMGSAGVDAGEKLTKSQQMHNKAMEDGIVTNEELRRISGQRMEEERKGIDAAMQARRKGVEGAKQDMGGFSDWIGGVMTAAKAPLAAMSQAAVQLFEDLRGISRADPDIDTSSLDATQRSLGGVARALDDVIEASASPFLSRLGRWQLDTQRASLETQKAFLGQKAAMQGLMESYSRGDMSAQRFVRSAQGAAQALGLLDDSDLSSLESAIRSAQQQMVQMERSTKSTLDSLNDELDALEGREADIERRKFASRRSDLEAQVAEASASGNAQAVANAQRALGLLRQVEVASEQQRQRAEQEKRVADAAATAPAVPAATEPAKVIRLESKGKTVDVPLGSAADETKLLDILADAGLRAI